MIVRAYRSKILSCLPTANFRARSSKRAGQPLLSAFRLPGWHAALLLASLYCLSLALPRPAPAQARQSIGRIWGEDVTVSSSTSLVSGRAAGVPILSGDVITVHSGEARMVLTAGGQIGVCGPAQFTLLESDGAITAALQFGRLHVILSSTTPFTVYTPFFQVTPQSLENGPRDSTIGLDPSGRFCARATHGGISLNQQLTGDSLTVPEPQEVFLDGGSVKPLRTVAASCTCDASSVPLPAAALAPSHPPPPIPVALPKSAPAPKTITPAAAASPAAKPAAPNASQQAAPQ